MTIVRLNFEICDEGCNTTEFIHEVSRAMSRAHREWVKFERRCVKYSDPKWQRRYTKAHKRSRRNVAYLKRTGRCR